MPFVLAVKKTLQEAFINLSRDRTRRLLLAWDDRVLADVGISRARLLEGNAAWPWRDDMSTLVGSVYGASSGVDRPAQFVGTPVVPVRSRRGHPAVERVTAMGMAETSASAVRSMPEMTRAEREAVRELQGYTDKELADLDLSREGIVDAVRCGRPGVEKRAA